jgi:glycosyltransferase involved in cell wall biosynthesis
MKVKASFVIAVKDCQAYIAQAVHSCLAQDAKKIETVVVNDGSTDGTRHVLDHLASLHDNLHVIHLEKNIGRSAARNYGIDAAKGDVVMILDGDDLSFGSRAKDTLKFLEKNPGIDYVYGRFQLIDEIGRPTGNVDCQPFDVERVKASGLTHIGHSTTAFRKKLFDTVKYTDGEFSQLGIDDWKFQIDAHKSGARFGAIQKTLAQYRVILKPRDEKRIMELKATCLNDL